MREGLGVPQQPAGDGWDLEQPGRAGPSVSGTFKLRSSFHSLRSRPSPCCAPQPYMGLNAGRVLCGLEFGVSPSVFSLGPACLFWHSSRMSRLMAGKPPQLGQDCTSGPLH